MKPELPNAWPGLAAAAPNSPDVWAWVAERTTQEAERVAALAYVQSLTCLAFRAPCDSARSAFHAGVSWEMERANKAGAAHSALLTRLSELEAGLEDIALSLEAWGAKTLAEKARALLEPRT